MSDPLDPDKKDEALGSVPPPAEPTRAAPPPPAGPTPPPPAAAQSNPFEAKKKEKLPAGLLAILLGSLGIHKFYLGYQKEAIIMLVVGLVGYLLCGIPTIIVGIIGIVEGVMYLTKTDEEFNEMYVKNQKPWF